MPLVVTRKQTPEEQAAERAAQDARAADAQGAAATLARVVMVHVQLEIMRPAPGAERTLRELRRGVRSSIAALAAQAAAQGDLEAVLRIADAISRPRPAGGKDR